MSEINISENVARLRKKRKITQDELAKFVGVTKASVSKWETGQSLPDVAMLPLLASYFNVTLDELVGYEPMLSGDQIKKIYHDLALEFADKEFEVVMARCEKLIKKYYSCYSFLEQMCVLLFNHFNLAHNSKRQSQIIDMIISICEHILKNCKDIGVCNDVTVISAMTALQKGDADFAIDVMENMMSPYRLSTQSAPMLIQAYIMKGDIDKADSFTQIGIYTNLLLLVSYGVQYISIHTSEDCCEEMIKRIDIVSDAFNLDEVNANIIASFSYQCALYYILKGKKEEALYRIKKYINLVKELCRDGIRLKGDDFFDRVEEWFENAALGPVGVRDSKVVIKSAAEAFDNPVFASVFSNEELESMKKSLLEEE